MVVDTTLYDILGVKPDASEKEIRKAYIQKAKEIHPDKNINDPKSTEKFQELNNAYQILKDPQARKRYDSVGIKNTRQPQSCSKQIRRTKDIKHELEVTLEDLYKGKETTLKIHRNVICSECKGSGCQVGKYPKKCSYCGGTGQQVKIYKCCSSCPGMWREYSECTYCHGIGEIVDQNDRCIICNGEGAVPGEKMIKVYIEPGMERGDELRFCGLSDEKKGFLPGDLIITLKMKYNNKTVNFERNHDNLLICKNINLSEAFIGVSFIIEHLDGHKLFIETKKNEIIDNNSVFVIEGEGMPKRGNWFEKGNLYAMTFASKIYNYHIPSIQGLISFSSEVNYLCPLSPYFSDFIEKGLYKLQTTNNYEPNLWDSLDIACKEIIDFRKDDKGNEKFKYAVSRILIISSGEDFRLISAPTEIAQKLIQYKIVVDSIVLCDDSGEKISSISHLTKGVCIKPTDGSDALSLIEQEAFLSIKRRIFNCIPLIKDDRSTYPNRIRMDNLTPNFMENINKDAYYDTEIINNDLFRANTKNRLATPSHVCSRNQQSIINNRRLRLILRELHLAAEIFDKNSDLYDPDMKIFTLKTSLDQWKVFIKGSENTPYENKWWFIYVLFPLNYPVNPPIMRFASIPYNLNVSYDGRICFHSLEKDYMPTKHVIHILQEIKEIFLLQNPEYAVEIGILDVFKNNPIEYERLARKSAIENAKDDFMDYVSIILDSVDPDFKLTFEEYVPHYMISQISGREIKDPVLSSTNVWYDREELKQLVESNKNPICVVTGKVLTEKLEDLDSI